MRAPALALALVLVTGALAPATPALAQVQAQAPTPTPAAPPQGHGMKSGIRAGLGQIDRLLDKVGATPDQKTRIKAIMFDAFMSLDQTGDSVKSALPAFVQSLTGPSVDRAAVERARAALVGDVDSATRALTRALADAAEVLTPEQRAKLAALVTKKAS